MQRNPYSYHCERSLTVFCLFADFIDDCALDLQEESFAKPLPSSAIQTRALFTKSGQLKVQTRDSTPVKKFTCNICNKYFASSFYLKQHLSKHSDEAEWPFECDVCGIRFIERAHLQVHRRSHSSLQCAVCEEQFSRWDSLIQHITKSHKDPSSSMQTLTCVECKKDFSLNSRHRGKKRVRNLTEKPNRCLFCEKQFPCWVDLQSHECHREYTCTLCDWTFVNWYNLNTHVRTHRHDGEYTCLLCDKRFKFLNSAVRHVHAHNDAQLFTCDVCIRKFRHASQLKEHRNDHFNGEQFTCNSCQEKRTSASPDVEDETSLCDEVPLGCDFCDKKFADNDKLEVHRRSHGEEAVYMCIVCTESFLNHSELKAHIRTHREETNVCRLCGKEFTRRNNFYRHMRQQHSGSWSFSTSVSQKQFIACDVCGKRFSDSAKLKSHKCAHSAKQERTTTLSKKGRKGSHPINSQTAVSKPPEILQEIVTNAGEKQIQGSRKSKHRQTDSDVRKNQNVGSKRRSVSRDGVQKQSTGSVGEKQIPGSYQVISNSGNTYACSVCSASFAVFRQLEAHLHQHRHEESFTCNLCNKQLTQCNNFIRHMRMHTGRQMFACGVCGKTSYRSDIIAKHMWSHSAGKQSTDRLSTESIATSPEAVQETSSPTNEDSFTCDVCHKSYTDSAAFEAHKSIHVVGVRANAGKHDTKPTSMSNQSNADKGDNQRSSTTGVSKKKDRSSHPVASNRNKYTCSCCSASFANYPQLETHLHSHRHEDIFTCNVCSIQIRRCSNFIRHMRIHFCTPPFSCGICGLRSHYACDIKKHMLIHTTERNFTCDDCGKKFTRQSNLNLHMRTHGYDIHL